MTFKDYLLSKKIEPKGFALGQPERFREWKAIFDQAHPDSFTAQKLFLINKLRRTYPLAASTDQEEKKVVPQARMLRPKLNITPKPKDQ